MDEGPADREPVPARRRTRRRSVQGHVEAGDRLAAPVQNGGPHLSLYRRAEIASEGATPSNVRPDRRALRRDAWSRGNRFGGDPRPGRSARRPRRLPPNVTPSPHPTIAAARQAAIVQPWRCLRKARPSSGRAGDRTLPGTETIAEC